MIPWCSLKELTPLALCHVQRGGEANQTGRSLPTVGRGMPEVPYFLSVCPFWLCIHQSAGTVSELTAEEAVLLYSVPLSYSALCYLLNMPCEHHQHFLLPTALADPRKSCTILRGLLPQRFEGLWQVRISPSYCLVLKKKAAPLHLRTQAALWIDGTVHGVLFLLPDSWKLTASGDGS